jgi:hypothetical protein
MPLTEAYVKSRIKAVRGQVLKVSNLKALKAQLGDSFTMADLKTVGHFNRVMRQRVNQFYRGDIDADAFLDDVVSLIDGQFTRAWNAGARDVGFDPKEMTDTDKLELMFRIDQEAPHILDFAIAIEEARINGTPNDALLARVDLWANRFNEVTNDARVYFGAKMEVPPKLVWRLGRTEEHCSTCAELNGTVATAQEWQLSGIRPQAAPNARLECGGWRCDCSLDPTDDPVTQGGIPSV